MNEEQVEEILLTLINAANFMRGMQFDPSLGAEQKKALNDKAEEIDLCVDKHTNDNEIGDL